MGTDSEFSHLGSDNQPQMVDVGHKEVTARMAHARGIVVVTDEILALLQGGELVARKGPVFQTATIAGVMAAKRTHELIPLCHPVPMEDCKITIVPSGQNRIVIDCIAKAHHKTGVEMEALTAVSAAALTVYDMCKAISKGIVIESIRLLEKTGGKTDYRAPPGDL